MVKYIWVSLSNNWNDLDKAQELFEVKGTRALMLLVNDDAVYKVLLFLPIETESLMLGKQTYTAADTTRSMVPSNV